MLFTIRGRSFPWKHTIIPPFAEFAVTKGFLGYSGIIPHDMGALFDSGLHLRRQLRTCWLWHQISQNAMQLYFAGVSRSPFHIRILVESFFSGVVWNPGFLPLAMGFQHSPKGGFTFWELTHWVILMRLHGEFVFSLPRRTLLFCAFVGTLLRWKRFLCARILSCFHSFFKGFLFWRI